MQIAVFIKSTTFHKGYGGLETQNKILCEGLAAAGHEITVFTLKRELTIDSENLNGVSYKFITSSFKYFLAHLNQNSWYNRSYLEFIKIHAQKPFDLVIGQSSGAWGIIARKKELNIKVVSIAHGSAISELTTFLKNIKGLRDLLLSVRVLQFELRQFFFRQRQFILNSNHIIAVSNFVKNSLIDETFVSPDKVTVIHNGLEPSLYKSTNLSIGTKILFLGQVGLDKGAGLLCDIMSSPSLKKYDMDVIGEGPYSSQLLAQINNLKINNIFLKGKLPYDKVLAELNSGKYGVFVFPTRRLEGFPMVLVEAMMSGLPVVAFDMGGVSDCIEDGKTGYLVKPDDVQTLTLKISEILENPQVQGEMSKNAKLKAMNEFSLDAMLNKYSQVLIEVTK